ncbi:MAG: NUDIX hydrolase [bacterium]|nr:NUDIX hydrolase [bacterium]
MKQKKRSVGIILFTYINGELHAILQKRGTFNFETMSPESYPGGCQGTAFGGVNPKETYEQGLKREMCEELGASINRLLKTITLKKVFRFRAGDRTVMTYAAIIPQSWISKIRLGAQSGGIALVNSCSSIKNLRDFSREQGVTDQRIVAMFPDALEALKEVFNLFKKNSPA